MLAVAQERRAVIHWSGGQWFTPRLTRVDVFSNKILNPHISSNVRCKSIWINESAT